MASAATLILIHILVGPLWVGWSKPCSAGLPGLGFSLLIMFRSILACVHSGRGSSSSGEECSFHSNDKGARAQNNTTHAYFILCSSFLLWFPYQSQVTVVKLEGSKRWENLFFLTSPSKFARNFPGLCIESLILGNARVLGKIRRVGHLKENTFWLYRVILWREWTQEGVRDWGQYLNLLQGSR